MPLMEGSLPQRSRSRGRPQGVSRTNLPLHGIESQGNITPERARVAHPLRCPGWGQSLAASSHLSANASINPTFFRLYAGFPHPSLCCSLPACLRLVWKPISAPAPRHASSRRAPFASRLLCREPSCLPACFRDAASIPTSHPLPVSGKEFDLTPIRIKPPRSPANSRKNDLHCSQRITNSRVFPCDRCPVFSVDYTLRGEGGTPPVRTGRIPDRLDRGHP